MKRFVAFVGRNKKITYLVAVLVIAGAFVRWEVREVDDATTGNPIERYRGIVAPWRACGIDGGGDRLVNFHVRHWLVYGLSTIDTRDQTTYGTAEKTHLTKAKNNPEHAVIVNFKYGSDDLTRLFTLEDRLEAAIAAAGVGEFDGNDVAVDGSDANLYMYGPNADKLFDVIRPILEGIDYMKGAKVTLRYGPPDEDVPEKVIQIGSKSAGIYE